MHQNAPNGILNLNNFPEVLPPGPRPLKALPHTPKKEQREREVWKKGRRGKKGNKDRDERGGQTLPP